MVRNKKCHIFNLDNLLIEIDQKIWIIDKSNPSECLMRISKENFNLIKSGVYKNDDLSMSFNGRLYWLDKKTFDELSKKVYKLSKSEELSFSFREFTDKDILDTLDIKYNLDCINHLKNSNDDVLLISTKGIEKKYGHYYTKLVDELKAIGILVNQVYYLNQSYFSQSKDRNVKKICYTLLSNILGKKIEEDKLTDTIDRDYSEVNYYDTNYITINKIDLQINSFLRRFEDDKINCKLILNLVGSNKLNPFKSMEVKLNRYVRTFENFKIIK